VNLVVIYGVLCLDSIQDRCLVILDRCCLHVNCTVHLNTRYFLVTEDLRLSTPMVLAEPSTESQLTPTDNKNYSEQHQEFT